MLKSMVSDADIAGVLQIYYFISILELYSVYNVSNELQCNFKISGFVLKFKSCFRRFYIQISGLNWYK